MSARGAGHSYLARYLSGDHARVWSELRALGPRVREPGIVEEGRAVALEIMRRARRNIELLQGRWSELGYVFGYGWAAPWARAMVEAAPPRLGAPTEDDARSLDAFEAEVGPLPLSLRALAEVVGAVNFVGSPPRRGFPTDPEQIDALQVEALVPQLAAWAKGEARGGAKRRPALTGGLELLPF